MFDWIIDLTLALDDLDKSPIRRDQWARFDAMGIGDQITFAADPNMQEDMKPYREAFKKRFHFKSFLIWAIKDRGRWLINFKRTV